MSESTSEDKDYVRWLQQESMLANANAIAGQFSGVGDGVAEPVRHPQSRSGDGEVVGLVHRLSHLDDHQARLFLPGHLGGRGSVACVRGDRHQCRAHRPPEAGRGGLRLGGDPQRRRALRPDQHPDRRGVRHRSGVPPPVRGGSGARRDRHRRHRARAHREGPRLPAGGDEGRRLSRDLPHGGDSARGLAPAARGARPARIRSTSTPRPRTGCSGPATSSAGCNG